MPTPTFDFYSRLEYFQDLTRRAAKLGRGDSITVMSMNFEPEVPAVGELVDALSDAAGRGVDVRLIIDAFSFILGKSNRPGPLFYGRPLTGRLARQFAFTYGRLEQLRQNGGMYYIINRPSRPLANPVAGRSHIKLALVNDRVYLGGCNLGDQTETDLMTAWQDAKTAAWLYELTKKIVADGTVQKALNGTDFTYKINDTSTIFVDSGIKRQSLIYEQALNFIDRAKKELLITCQYFPGGPTARHLLQAQKHGVDVTILFSGPAAHRTLAAGHQLYNLRERSRLPADFFANMLPANKPKLHAKLIATGNGAMLGSHNYIDVGVKLGTAEIALSVNDPGFAEAAVDKITALIE